MQPMEKEELKKIIADKSAFKSDEEIQKDGEEFLHKVLDESKNWKNQPIPRPDGK